MNNLKKELDQYGRCLLEEECPLSDAELNRAIRHATWQEPTAAPAPPSVAKTHNSWPWIATAACLAALLIPLARTDSTARKQPRPGMTFICNNGCQSQEILARIDKIIK